MPAPSWKTVWPTSARDIAHFEAIIQASKAQALYGGPPSVPALRTAYAGFASSPLARKPQADTQLSRDSLAGRTAYRIVPARLSSPDVLLYLHGGAFTIGCFEGEVGVGDSFARAFGMETFGLAYAQAPEHPFPAAVEDTVAAVGALRARFPNRRIFIAGDSAGGTLAIAAALRLRDAGLPQPAGLIAVSAVFDLRMESPSWTANEGRDLVTAAMGKVFFDLYLNGAAPDDPLASPVCADLRGLTPMFLAAGTHELMIDDVIAFAEKAVAAGCAVALHMFEALPHNFVKFIHPCADEVYRQAARWMAHRL